MERSPIRDIKIKHLLSAALTDRINDRQVYMKGIDHACLRELLQEGSFESLKIRCHIACPVYIFS